MSSSVYFAVCVALLSAPAALRRLPGDLLARSAKRSATPWALPGALVQRQSSAPVAPPVHLSSDATGGFRACSPVYSDYQLSISAPGFASISQPVHIGDTPGVPLTIVLSIAHDESTTTVTAESEDRLEIDRALGLALQQRHKTVPFCTVC